MNRISRIAVATLPWFALLAAGCGDDRTASTQILNPPTKGTVTGILLDADGSPVAGARVSAYPVDFDPVSDDRRDRVRKLADTTDGTGAYSIEGLDSGSYNLLAVRASDGTRLLIRDVRMGRDSQVTLAGRRLARPGAMTIHVPDSLKDADAYVYVPGTPIHANVDPAGEALPVLLDSVPAGVAPGITYHAPGRNSVPEVLAREVPVSPGDTVPADAYRAWKRSTRIILGTEAMNPPLATPLADFPLLVRLEAGFDYAGARGDGGDLRFTREDGHPLSHEVEAWDSAAGYATLWVRLDTLRPTGSRQFIRMYWGNPEATKPGYGGVFRKQDGYRGVYHLAESGDSPAALFANATSGNDSDITYGRNNGLTAASRMTSPLGYGQQFLNPGTWLNLSNAYSLHMDSALSLEAWIRPDEYALESNLISRAFDTAAGPQYEYGLTLGDVREIYRFIVAVDTGRSVSLFSFNGKAVMGKWQHVVGTYDGAKLRIFVDGVPTDSLNHTGRIPSFGHPTLIGRYHHFPSRSLNGALDEVRISDRARSAEHIRLSYWSQRPDANFLRFEP